MENMRIYKAFLGWEKVEELNATDTILVNSNRLYWQLSELKRINQNGEEVLILTKNIGRIRDERSMYVPMQVKDVKKCFGMCGYQLPKNTFRRRDYELVDMNRKKRKYRKNPQNRKKKK